MMRSLARTFATATAAARWKAACSKAKMRVPPLQPKNTQETLWGSLETVCAAEKAKSHKFLDADVLLSHTLTTRDRSC